MLNAHDFTAETLALCRRAIASGRDAAEVPNGYLNFDIALAIIDGCRDAITMADAQEPGKIIPTLKIAADSLGLVQSGAAESSVTTVRTCIEEAIAALRVIGAEE